MDDYYYYNGFGGTSGSDGEGSVYEPISIASRHNAHHTVHRIPSFVYAAFIALIACIVTGTVLMCRYKKNRFRSLQNGSIHRFHQIPGDDDDSVFESTAIGGEDENPFKNGKGGGGARNDLYGSL